MIVEKKAPGVHLLKLMETPDLTIDQYFAGMSNDLAFDTYFLLINKISYNFFLIFIEIIGAIWTRASTIKCGMPMMCLEGL
jgi:hypothetical protein